MKLGSKEVRCISTMILMLTNYENIGKNSLRVYIRCDKD